MKRSLISIIIAILVLSMFSVVNAATASINLGASSNQVKAGEVFTVTIIGTADSNITALQSDLSYDSSKLSIENKTVGTGFYDYSSGNNEISIGIQNTEALSKTTTLYTITFKVLDTASEGETVISFKNVTLAVVNANNEQEEVSVANDSISVDIVKEISEDGTGEKEEQTPVDPEDGKQESDEKENTNDTEKDTTKLPQTGIEEVSIVSVVILAVITTLSYIGYRRYKDI